MAEVEISSPIWQRFDEAVYEFAHECAEAERNEGGCVEPPGRTLWAYGYMPTFFGRIDGEVFQELGSLDEDLIQSEVEKRFVRLFQEAWHEEDVG